jgi:endonuclease YncB( thermonuclease family)
MAHRIIVILSLGFLCLAAEVRAAMVRVIEVKDGRTLVVEHKGEVETIRLSGVQITDEVQARALLNWTLSNSWVMIEAQGDAYDVYRSPDALYINRELVLRGYARATRANVGPPAPVIVTYLGVLKPTSPQMEDEEEETNGRRAKKNNGKSRRSSGSRSRSSKSRRAAPSNPSSD